MELQETHFFLTHTYKIHLFMRYLKTTKTLGAKNVLLCSIVGGKQSERQCVILLAQVPAYLWASIHSFIAGLFNRRPTVQIQLSSNLRVA